MPARSPRAGLSFSSVYRRFPDKDGLMREVFMPVAEMNYEIGQEKTARQLGRANPCVGGRALIGRWIASYRSYAGLLRASMLNIEWRLSGAMRLQLAAFERVVQFLLTWRAEIRY